jgi:hypothetical protein
VLSEAAQHFSERPHSRIVEPDGSLAKYTGAANPRLHATHPVQGRFNRIGCCL